MDIPDTASVHTIVAWLQEQGRSAHLQLRGPTTLKTIPGSRHWHISAGKDSGTLEVTIDTVRHVATISVHANRRGNWAGEAAKEWAHALRTVLLADSGGKRVQRCSTRPR
jgi:hypothetical protein